MRVAITGGHFAPALAIIEKLQSTNNNQVVIVGRKYAFEGDKAPSYEYTVSKQKNLTFIPINPPRIARKNVLKSAFHMFALPSAIKQARNILKQTKPDVLLSFGSYLAVPIALAAKQQNIPIVIHEQTQKAGASNKLLSKIADKVCISFKSSEDFFPKEKTVLTGNPLRSEIFEVKQSIKNIDTSKKVIYITGGSTGAHSINQAIKLILPELLKKYSVIHQTGATTLTNDYEDLKSFRDSLDNKLKKSYIVKKYVTPEEIGWVYKNSDLVISRAGINTVLELAAVQKKAILIPLEAGQKNEQFKNAKLFEKTNLGTTMLQKNLEDSSLFLQIIDKTFIQRRKVMQKNKDINFYIPNASDKIVDILEELA